MIMDLETIAYEIRNCIHFQFKIHMLTFSCISIKLLDFIQLNSYIFETPIKFLFEKFPRKCF